MSGGCSPLSCLGAVFGDDFADEVLGNILSISRRRMWRKHTEEKVINRFAGVADGTEEVHFCLNHI